MLKISVNLHKKTQSREIHSEQKSLNERGQNDDHQNLEIKLKV